MKILEIAKRGKKKFETIDTKGFEFKSMKDLYRQGSKKHTLRGFFKTQSNFGEQYVLITDNCFINSPMFLNDTLKEIYSDDESIEAINQGIVDIEIYEFDNERYRNKGYSISFDVRLDDNKIDNK